MTWAQKYLGLFCIGFIGGRLVWHYELAYAALTGGAIVLGMVLYDLAGLIGKKP